MNYSIKTRDEHWRNDGNPKRILSLDGGGLRGVLTLAYLAKVEQLLRNRHGGNEDFRLNHYYDLIAGTSTGAIIAGGLAIGMTVQQITDHYFRLGENLFEKSLFRNGLIRAKYDATAVSEEMKSIFGEDTTLGSGQVKTGLLVMTKRLDTGSPWPLTNNPNGRYYDHSENDVIPNKDYPLWSVIRASTAAPVFFESEKITIASAEGKKPVVGNFIDGGVSPFNNPTLQALMLVSLGGYGVNWNCGEDKILITSIGTGAADPSRKGSSLAAAEGITALTSLMDDCASLVETMMQWMAASSLSRSIDRELGDLSDDTVGNNDGNNLLSYCRYNVVLDDETVNRELEMGVDAKVINSLSSMDAPENMRILFDIGGKAAERQIRQGQYPDSFNLA